MSTETKTTEQTASHTPGPWAVPDIDGVWDDTIPIHALDGSVVGTAWPLTYRCGDDDPETQANARLIAAAPELLEALRNLLSTPEVEDLADEEVWQKAVAAVAKATGTN